MVVSVVRQGTGLADGDGATWIIAHSLYESEEKSDVVFLVGEEGCRERIPAHSAVLSSRNPVFKAMFHESWVRPRHSVYNIPNDPKGFQNLLKWLYRRESSFQSLESALTTLHVAIQYLCPDLADQSAAYISQHLREDNVLRVLQQVYRYCPGPLPLTPSAPSLEVLEGRAEALARDVGEEIDDRNPVDCCGDLFNECLEILDRDGSLVLECEEVEELDRDALEVILKRQSLGVRSEVEVVRAAVRWCTAQCKRANFPLTPSNRRQVLGSLLFSLRLLNLSPEQVCEASKLLDKEEVEYIQAQVSKKAKKKVSPPPSLVPHLSIMAKPRGPPPVPAAAPDPPPANRKKINKKKYNKKELLLDIVSFLAIIFD